MTKKKKRKKDQLVRALAIRDNFLNFDFLALYITFNHLLSLPAFVSLETL